MGKLGCSESNFQQNCRHDLSYVVGMFGLNTRANKYPYNPYDTRGNIWSASYKMRELLNIADGNYEEALTYYKGWSDLGRRQARHVLSIEPKETR